MDAATIKSWKTSLVEEVKTPKFVVVALLFCVARRRRVLSAERRSLSSFAGVGPPVRPSVARRKKRARPRGGGAQVFEIVIVHGVKADTAREQLQWRGAGVCSQRRRARRRRGRGGGARRLFFREKDVAFSETVKSLGTGSASTFWCCAA